MLNYVELIHNYEQFTFSLKEQQEPWLHRKARVLSYVVHPLRTSAELLNDAAIHPGTH